MNVPRIAASELLSRVGIRAAIFDMDGVLADTEEFHLEAWQRLVDAHGIASISHETVKRTFGQTNDVIIPQLWRLGGRADPGAQLGSLSREKETYYREAAAGRVRPLRGSERLIRHFVGLGVPLAVGTSAPLENVRFLLDEFGWHDLFDVLVHRSLFARGKPEPDCFLEAARRLPSSPRRTIVFEDSIHGLLAARRGRFVACGLATTKAPTDLRRHARWVLRDFTEISC